MYPTNPTASHRNTSRAIALIVALSFIFSDFAWAAVDVFSPATIASAVSKAQKNETSFLEVPSQFGKLKEIQRGNNGKLIVHLQDAHSNLSGQKNLAAILDVFMSRGLTGLVLSEGGSGDCTLTPLKRIAGKETWKRVAGRHLAEGAIAGEEYLNLTSDYDMKIIGIEDSDLYMKSVRGYAELAKDREEILAYLKKIKYALNCLKSRFYSPRLMAYEKIKRSDPSDMDPAIQHESLMKLARETGEKFEDFPSLRRMDELERQEKLIDLEQASPERTALMEAIANLDLEGITDEWVRLEDKIYARELSRLDARRVRALDRFIGLLWAAYNIRMSSEDFKTLKINAPDFGTERCLGFINTKLSEYGYQKNMVPYSDCLERGAQALHEFYDSVAQRDHAFVQNTEKVLKESGKDSAMLVCGGYHTEHLKKLFTEKGYSFAVVTPNVTSETNQKKYEKFLFGSIAQSAERPAKASLGLSGKNSGVRAMLVLALLGHAGIRLGSDADRLLRDPRFLQSEFYRLASDAASAESSTRIGALGDEDASKVSLSRALQAMGDPVEYQLSAARLASDDPLGQCVTGDTLLPLLREGESVERLVPIREVVSGDQVLSLNEKTQSTEFHRIKGLMDMGVKPVFELTTASGRSIKTTTNHPYYVRKNSWKISKKVEGEWIKVSELKVGDEVGVAGQTDQGCYEDIFSPSGELNQRLGSRVVSFPSYTPHSSSIFSKEWRRVSGWFCGILNQITPWISLVARSQKSQSLVTKTDLSFFDSEAMDRSSVERGTDENFIFFDRRYRPNSTRTFSSSKNLGMHVDDGKTFSGDGAGVFQSSLDMLGRKRGEGFSYPLSGLATGQHIENLPHHHTSSLKSRLAMTDVGVRNDVRIDYNSCHSRDSFWEYNTHFSQESISHRLKSIPNNTPTSFMDVWISVAHASPLENRPSLAWDPIVSIKPLGPMQVYDIEVEGTHNFIGNGIFAHNTYLGSAPNILLAGSDGARMAEELDWDIVGPIDQGLTPEYLSEGFFDPEKTEDYTKRPYKSSDLSQVILGKDQEFSLKNQGMLYGNTRVFRTLWNHAEIVPLIRHWKRLNPDRHLLILNVDAHHDRYTSYHRVVNDANWVSRVENSTLATVFHVQPDPNLRTNQTGLSPTAPVSLVDSLTKNKKLLSYDEVWVTVDFDYFSTHEAFRNYRFGSSYDLGREARDQELEGIVNHLVGQGINVTGVLPVVSPTYLAYGKNNGDARNVFVRELTDQIHDIMGRKYSVLARLASEESSVAGRPKDRPVAARLASDPPGQCVTGDTLLPLLREGESVERLVPIREVVSGDQVLSLNEKTQSTEFHRIKGLMDMGVKPVFELTTASGRSIKTTTNHPYYVRKKSWKISKKVEGEWIKVSELKVGDEVGVAGDLPFPVDVFPQVNSVDHNFGVLDEKTNPVFSNSEPMSRGREVYQRSGKGERGARGQKNIHFFQDALSDLWGKLIKLSATSDIEFNCPWNTWAQRSPKDCFIFLSGTKPRALPFSIFFFNLLVSSGLMGRCCSISSMSHPTGFWWVYSSAVALSSSLASQAQSISQSDWVSNTKYFGEPFLSTTTADLKFFGNANPRFFKFLDMGEKSDKGFNRTNVFSGSFKVVGKCFIFLSSYAFKYSTTFTSNLLPACQMVRPAHASPIEPRPSLIWDPIVSIEPLGPMQVYDIEVEGTHNFVGNGIFAHNTYLGSAPNILLAGSDGARMAKRELWIEHHGFVGKKITLPPHLNEKVNVLSGRIAGGQKVYGVGERRGRRDDNFIEFSSKNKNPDIKLTIESVGEEGTQWEITFSNGSTTETKMMNAPESRSILLLNIPHGREFSDAVLGIPAEFGSMRARAIRDWLLDLKSHGRASQRDKSYNVGLRYADLRMPWGIRKGEVLVDVLSEREGRGRFVMFVDQLNPDLYVVFESIGGRVVDVLTGESLSLLPAAGEKPAVIPADVGFLREFMTKASRALFVTTKKSVKTKNKKSGSTFYPLRRTKDLKHELGLPRNRELAVIKVDHSTSATATGGMAAGRRGGEDAEGREGWVSYPVMIGGLDLLKKTEEMPKGLSVEGLKDDKGHLVFRKDSVGTWPDFLGYSRDEGGYGYYKKYEGFLRDADGHLHAVYRLLDFRDKNVAFVARMQGDDFFTIDGVVWKVGAMEDKPVLFSGRINIPLLAMKYANSDVMDIPSSLSGQLRPEADNPNIKNRPHRPPILEIRKSIPVIVPGPITRVTAEGLSDQAGQEKKKLKKFKSSDGARMAKKIVIEHIPKSEKYAEELVEIMRLNDIKDAESIADFLLSIFFYSRVVSFENFQPMNMGDVNFLNLGEPLLSQPQHKVFLPVLGRHVANYWVSCGINKASLGGLIYDGARKIFDNAERFRTTERINLFVSQMPIDFRLHAHLKEMMRELQHIQVIGYDHQKEQIIDQKSDVVLGGRIFRAGVLYPPDYALLVHHFQRILDDCIVQKHEIQPQRTGESLGQHALHLLLPAFKFTKDDPENKCIPNERFVDIFNALSVKDVDMDNFFISYLDFLKSIKVFGRIPQRVVNSENVLRALFEVNKTQIAGRFPKTMKRLALVSTAGEAVDGPSAARMAKERSSAGSSGAREKLRIVLGELVATLVQAGGYDIGSHEYFNRSLTRHVLEGVDQTSGVNEFLLKLVGIPNILLTNGNLSAEQIVEYKQHYQDRIIPLIRKLDPAWYATLPTADDWFVFSTMFVYPDNEFKISLNKLMQVLDYLKLAERVSFFGPHLRASNKSVDKEDHYFLKKSIPHLLKQFDQRPDEKLGEKINLAFAVINALVVDGTDDEKVTEREEGFSGVAILKDIESRLGDHKSKVKGVIELLISSLNNERDWLALERFFNYPKITRGEAFVSAARILEVLQYNREAILSKGRTISIGDVAFATKKSRKFYREYPRGLSPTFKKFRQSQRFKLFEKLALFVGVNTEGWQGAVSDVRSTVDFPKDKKPSGARLSRVYSPLRRGVLSAVGDLVERDYDILHMAGAAYSDLERGAPYALEFANGRGFLEFRTKNSVEIWARDEAGGKVFIKGFALSLDDIRRGRELLAEIRTRTNDGLGSLVDTDIPQVLLELEKTRRVLRELSDGTPVVLNVVASDLFTADQPHEVRLALAEALPFLESKGIYVQLGALGEGGQFVPLDSEVGGDFLSSSNILPEALQSFVASRESLERLQVSTASLASFGLAMLQSERSRAVPVLLTLIKTAVIRRSGGDPSKIRDDMSTLADPLKVAQAEPQALGYLHETDATTFDEEREKILRAIEPLTILTLNLNVSQWIAYALSVSRIVSVAA